MFFNESLRAFYPLQKQRPIIRPNISHPKIKTRLLFRRKPVIIEKNKFFEERKNRRYDASP